MTLVTCYQCGHPLSPGGVTDTDPPQRKYKPCYHCAIMRAVSKLLQAQSLDEQEHAIHDLEHIYNCKENDHVEEDQTAN